MLTKDQIETLTNVVSAQNFPGKDAGYVANLLQTLNAMHTRVLTPNPTPERNPVDASLHDFDEAAYEARKSCD